MIPSEFERHHLKLKEEHARKNRNDELIKQLLVDTFRERRQRIETAQIPTMELAKIFPYLVKSKWVSTCTLNI